MRILAVGVGTVALGEMQTVWHSLWRELMGEIAIVAVDAPTLLQKVFTDGNLVWVMLVSARRPFGTGSCDKS